MTFALGQTLFALGRDGDAKQLAAARQCFAQLLKQNPKDSTTRAALGLAFLFDQPPQAARAVAELRQARQDSRQPASVLPGLIAALISLGQSAEAATSLQELARLDPNNLALPELRARLEALSGPPTPAVSH